MVVRVSDIIRAVVVNHNPLVEGVKFEAAILPFLGFLLEVGCEEAAKFENWGGVLGERDGGGDGGWWHYGSSNEVASR